MMDFDRELHEALKRREPPRDLTGSVMARIERHSQVTPLGRGTAWKRWPWVSAAAGIAAALVMSVGAYRWQEYQKGQQAKRQVMLALKVTAQKLAVAERKVSELNHGRIGYE